jgi:hypothetical protein
MMAGEEPVSYIQAWLCPRFKHQAAVRAAPGASAVPGGSRAASPPFALFSGPRAASSRGRPCPVGAVSAGGQNATGLLTPRPSPGSTRRPRPPGQVERLAANVTAVGAVCCCHRASTLHLTSPRLHFTRPGPTAGRLPGPAQLNMTRMASAATAPGPLETFFRKHPFGRRSHSWRRRGSLWRGEGDASCPHPGRRPCWAGVTARRCQARRHGDGRPRSSSDAYENEPGSFLSSPWAHGLPTEEASPVLEAAEPHVLSHFSRIAQRWGSWAMAATPQQVAHIPAPPPIFRVAVQPARLGRGPGQPRRMEPCPAPP